MPKFWNLRKNVCDFWACPLVTFLLCWGWHVMGWEATLECTGKDNTLGIAEQQHQRHVGPWMTLQSKANKPARLTDRDINLYALQATVTWGLSCTTKPISHLMSFPAKCQVCIARRYLQRSTLLAWKLKKLFPSKSNKRVSAFWVQPRTWFQAVYPFVLRAVTWLTPFNDAVKKLS